MSLWSSFLSLDATSDERCLFYDTSINENSEAARMEEAEKIAKDWSSIDFSAEEEYFAY